MSADLAFDTLQKSGAKFFYLDDESFGILFLSWPDPMDHEQAASLGVAVKDALKLHDINGVTIVSLGAGVGIHFVPDEVLETMGLQRIDRKVN